MKRLAMLVLVLVAFLLFARPARAFELRQGQSVSLPAGHFAVGSQVEGWILEGDADGLVGGELVEDRGVPLGERWTIHHDPDALLLGVLAAEALQNVGRSELEPGDVQGAGELVSTVISSSSLSFEQIARRQAIS